jgi:hypothetical protein
LLPPGISALQLGHRTDHPSDDAYLTYSYTIRTSSAGSGTALNVAPRSNIIDRSGNLDQTRAVPFLTGVSGLFGKRDEPMVSK